MAGEAAEYYYGPLLANKEAVAVEAAYQVAIPNHSPILVVE
jgi:hypothetical protein